MGQHDEYGKGIMESVLDQRWKENSSYPIGKHKIVIDGAILSRDSEKQICAVEIESRVNKQIRGAILDLLLSKEPKKLLILIRGHMKNSEESKELFEEIFERLKDNYKKKFNYKVVCFKGNGDRPRQKEDEKIIKRTLKEMKIW